tara:strand:+ start:590 stop:1198 length:609 start_codon:yes stop_codon:yes gene_type:complete
MLFDNNSKLLVVLVLAVVLIYLLNRNEPLSNDGTVSVEENPSAEVENMDEKVVGHESTTEHRVEAVSDESLVDEVVDITGNDLSLGSAAEIEAIGESVTEKNMKKLMEENEKNKLKFNSGDLLPQEVNNDWFETDFSHAQVNVNDENLVVTDKYVVGVNTVGQSLKNASYDLRAAPPCPKFSVSPWLQSTIEPDFNIKNLME